MIAGVRLSATIPLTPEIDTINVDKGTSLIKEIVAYAKDRYITIVPEIEMPGHSIAALAAYPQFSCTGGPFEVRAAW